ncbi:ATP-binding protein [Sphaerisporangium sp. NPDC051011]|uniref:ATP-binding protein n=1 Tax=Sphaerisporangium sp. NPDC051011 TaxID=3155792 RepID=UPI0033DE4FA1
MTAYGTARHGGDAVDRDQPVDHHDRGTFSELTGELLANAVTYGEPPIRLSMWMGNGELCVRVTDHGPELPRHLRLGAWAVHGRGLVIVAALADDHGVTQPSEEPGKTVWARWWLPGRETTDSHATQEASIPQQSVPQGPIRGPRHSLNGL